MCICFIWVHVFINTYSVYVYKGVEKETEEVNCFIAKTKERARARQNLKNDIRDLHWYKEALHEKVEYLLEIRVLLYTSVDVDARVCAHDFRD